jgi:hypothetical protein
MKADRLHNSARQLFYGASFADADHVFLQWYYCSKQRGINYNQNTKVYIY